MPCRPAHWHVGSAHEQGRTLTQRLEDELRKRRKVLCTAEPCASGREQEYFQSNLVRSKHCLVEKSMITHAGPFFHNSGKPPRTHLGGADRALAAGEAERAAVRVARAAQRQQRCIHACHGVAARRRVGSQHGRRQLEKLGAMSKHDLDRIYTHVNRLSCVRQLGCSFLPDSGVSEVLCGTGTRHGQQQCTHLIWRTSAASRPQPASQAKMPWSCMSFQMAPCPPGLSIGASGAGSSQRPSSAPTSGTSGCRNSLKA